MANRENKNIWKRLVTFDKVWNKDRTSYYWHWWGKSLFRKHWWRSDYIFHDSIGVFFNRWIKCPLLGHKNVQTLREDCDDVYFDYCFDCESKVNE